MSQVEQIDLGVNFLIVMYVIDGLTSNHLCFEGRQYSRAACTLFWIYIPIHLFTPREFLITISIF